MRDANELKQASREVWGTNPAGYTFGGGAAIGSREFFEAVLAKRSSYEQPWLTEIVPFTEFRDKDVLELGCGAGYDAYTFIVNGARYTGIDITPENPDRVRQHLAHYGLKPNVLEADAEQLPFEDESFDVVYSNGVLMATPDMPRAFREACRVLRPGGSFYLSLYHRDSIFYWLTLGFTEQILRLGFRKQTLHERLAMIETTGSAELPHTGVYSRRQLRRLLAGTGFETRRIYVRKLVAEDLPGIPGFTRLWPSIPQPWLDKIGERWGWYVWTHSIKPA